MLKKFLYACAITAFSVMSLQAGIQTSESTIAPGALACDHHEENCKSGEEIIEGTLPQSQTQSQMDLSCNKCKDNRLAKCRGCKKRRNLAKCRGCKKRRPTAIACGKCK